MTGTVTDVDLEALVLTIERDGGGAVRVPIPDHQLAREGCEIKTRWRAGDRVSLPTTKHGPRRIATRPTFETKEAK